MDNLSRDDVFGVVLTPTNISLYSGLSGGVPLPDGLFKKGRYVVWQVERKQK